jgi:hypothetical protein
MTHMRRRTGYGYRPPRPPHITGKDGKNSIDDFPLVPEKPKFILPLPVWDCVVRPAPSAPATPPAPPPPAPPAATPPEPPINADTQPSATAEAAEPSPVNAQAQLAESIASAVGVSADEVNSLLDVSKRVLEQNPEAVRTFQRHVAKKTRKHRRGTKRRSPAVEEPESPLERHERLCSICNSSYRDEIEEEFLHWMSPPFIALEYGLDRRAIYRHAHALGLFEKRDRNYRFALGYIIEKAARVKPTADAIIRAVRTASCLLPDGSWAEPPAHVIVSSGSRIAAAQPITSPAIALDVPSAAETGVALIDTPCRIEPSLSD